MRLRTPEHYTFSETITSNTIFIEILPCFQIDPSGKKILHIHEYRVKGDMSNRPGRLLTSDEYEKYKKYIEGNVRWKMGM
jgi:hypothetical protein